MSIGRYRLVLIGGFSRKFSPRVISFKHPWIELGNYNCQARKRHESQYLAEDI